MTMSEEPHGRKTIRLRLLRPVYSREVIREDAPDYLSARRYSSPSQVYELFRDLSSESRSTSSACTWTRCTGSSASTASPSATSTVASSTPGRCSRVRCYRPRRR